MSSMWRIGWSLPFLLAAATASAQYSAPANYAPAPADSGDAKPLAKFPS